MAEPHEAAKWRVDDAHDDAPTAEPMTGKGAKPAERRKPDTDQKKVRRQMAHASGYTSQDFGNTVISAFDELEADRNLRLSPPAKSWNIADSGDRHGGSGDAGGESVSQSQSSPSSNSAGSSGGSSSTASLPGVEHAGDRECEACGTVGSPVLDGTSPSCSACGSYSLKASPVSRARQKAATRMDSNVATSDGRILIQPGDQIKTPTGQALNVKNIRRHETSRDHYYVDTDAGTTLVPWTTNFTLVPNNQSQQVLPGAGISGGNFNTVPGIEEDGSAGAPSVCPGCGSKGTLNRQGQAFKCNRCGFTDKNVGGDMNFSDARQQIRSSRTAGVIAQRALTVLAQEEENQS